MIVTLWSQTKEHAINVLVFGVARVLFQFIFWLIVTFMTCELFALFCLALVSRAMFSPNLSQ